MYCILSLRNQDPGAVYEPLDRRLRDAVAAEGGHVFEADGGNDDDGSAWASVEIEVTDIAFANVVRRIDRAVTVVML